MLKRYVTLKVREKVAVSAAESMQPDSAYIKAAVAQAMKVLGAAQPGQVVTVKLPFEIRSLSLYVPLPDSPNGGGGPGDPIGPSAEGCTCDTTCQHNSDTTNSESSCHCHPDGCTGGGCSPCP